MSWRRSVFILQDSHGPVQTPWSAYEAKRMRMFWTSIGTLETAVVFYCFGTTLHIWSASLLPLVQNRYTCPVWKSVAKQAYVDARERRSLWFHSNLLTSHVLDASFATLTAREYFNLTLILVRNLTSSRPNLEFSLCADLLVSTSVAQVSLSRYVSEKPSFWPFLSNTLWEGHSLLRHRALLSPTVSLLLLNKVAF